MNDCIFCQIVAGTEKRHHVWEDDQFLAFLDRKPVNPGHLLIIPKQHVGYVFEMPDELYRGLFDRAKKLEPALKRLTKAPRIGLVVEGFGVDHVHLHVIPIFHGHDLDPVRPREKEMTSEEMDAMAKKIQAELH